MGRIPEYQRSSFASQVETSMVAQSNPLIESIGKLADAGFEIAQKRQRIQNENFLAQKSIELETKSDEIFQQWQKDHEDDPVGKEDDLKERLSKVRDEIIGAAPSSSAQQEFSMVSDKYYAQVYGHANKWQDEQLKNNTMASAETGLDSLKTKILRNPHPGNFETLMQEGEMVLGPLKEAAGVKVSESARTEFAKGLSLTMFQGLVEKNNLGAASQLLSSRKYDEHLGAEGILHVQQLIDIRQKQNVERAQKMQEMKYKSPWEFYLHSGGQANPIAFDPGQDPTGNSLRNSLLQRQSIVLDAKQKMDLDLPMFTPQETDGLIRHLKNTGTKDTLDFFSFYDRNITDEQKNLISRQVFEKEPSMGIALSISNDAPEDAQRVITGTKLMRSDPSKITAVFAPKDGTVDVEAAFDTYLGNATEDADFRRQLKDAAMAHYTTMALRSDKAVSSFDPELFKESIAAVSAPVFDHNGRDVFSFRDKTGKFVDQSNFEDFAGQIDDQMIESLHGDVPRTISGEPINVSKGSGQVSFIPAQSGRYYVLFQGRATVDKSGRPFVLNMKDLYDKNHQDSFWQRIWK